MPDKDDEALWSDFVQWMLQNEDYKAMRSYLDRGRPYRARDAEGLAARWIVLFEELAVLDNTNEQERHDIEAELALRGIARPVERAMDTLKAFKKRVDESWATLVVDPDGPERARRLFDQALKEYAADLTAVRS